MLLEKHPNIEEVQEVSITNLFPNPVQENATIAINATSAQSISLNIVGITGKVLNSTNHVLSSGKQHNRDEHLKPFARDIFCSNRFRERYDANTTICEALGFTT